LRLSQQAQQSRLSVRLQIRSLEAQHGTSRAGKSPPNGLFCQYDCRRIYTCVGHGTPSVFHSGDRAFRSSIAGVDSGVNRADHDSIMPPWYEAIAIAWRRTYRSFGLSNSFMTRTESSEHDDARQPVD
jgi:hypothetical protein